LLQTDAATFTPVECQISVSQHQSSDTFSAKIALDDPSGLDESYWLGTAPLNVTVSATNDVNSGGYVTMLTGAVDKIEVEFATRMVHISGRDKTAKLIDRKTNEKWLNKQPQDIINDLAGRVGLSVQFNGKPQDRAGLKYKDDYNRISELDSCWNIIVRLAKDLGCIAFVKGDTLNIQPWDASGGGIYNVFYQRPGQAPAQANFIRLTCTRDLHLAKKIKVNHKSWQHKAGKAIETEFEYDGSGDDGDVLEHSYKAANLTKQQQDQLAGNHLDHIVSHERGVALDMPGDVNLDPTMMLALSGTGTAADQSYVISAIDHHWSFHSGYTMRVRVRNKSKLRGDKKQNK
jgi:phage protein D